MRRLAALVLVPLVLTACGGSADRDAAAPPPPPGDASLLVPYGEELPTGGSGGGTTGAALSLGAPSSSRAGSGAEDSSAAGSSAAPGGGGSTGGSGSTGGAPAPAGPLRAGSVDDNARFADFLAFLERSTVPADALAVSERHVVTVRDRDGRPVLGARVALVEQGGDRELQSARTHADGRALLFPLETSSPRATAYDLVVRSGDATERVGLPDRAVRQHEVALDVSREQGPTRLDLHFLLDTTGSMGDEIDRLRTTLDDVAAQIAALPQAPQVRYGLTVYKDEGDAYVSRTGDFTDLATFRAELAEVSADGGGDTPEALDEALHAAVGGPAWDSDRAVQIAFLVADASPHLGKGTGPSYAEDVKVAAAKGIEVVPLASSGSDDAAEHVFRQVAQYTLGTFFFLTYGADGRSPGDTTDLSVTGFETGSLDELVVRHVAARLAARDGRGPGQ